MDISVSRLNNRMALQVPAVLPLGLVFIVGQVTNLVTPDERERNGPGQEDSPYVSFDLLEAGHHLACRLPQQVAAETFLRGGDRVRASGYLVFEPRVARYLLLARDVEVLPAAAPSRTTFKTILEDVQKRAEAASVVQAELPSWVRQMAPSELETEEAAAEPEKAPLFPPSDVVTAVDEAVAELPREMIAFLSGAIDSDEEIELTQEMIDEYLPATGQQPALAREEMTAAPVAETGAQPEEGVRAQT
ncbi:MAG TPA: hypothetical protein VE553_00815, partial [Candidatus Binatia bacterium]|nr:hypothetical protein [Candidatus Binatia bacterium]